MELQFGKDPLKCALDIFDLNYCTMRQHHTTGFQGVCFTKKDRKVSSKGH